MPFILQPVSAEVSLAVEEWSPSEPFDAVFFDADTILILPRSENSILILN